jgi:VanZ family protein
VRTLIGSTLVVALLALGLAVYDPYTAGSSDLLPPLDFASDQLPDGWTRSKLHASVDPAEGELVITSGTGQRDGGALLADLSAPRRFEALRLSFDVSVEDVQPTLQDSYTFRAVIFFEDPSGRRLWEHRHEVCKASGTRSVHCDGVITVPEQAQVGHLFVGNQAARGVARIDNVSLRAVVSKRSRRWVEIVCAIGLTGVLVHGLWSLRFWRDRWRVGATLVAASIIAGTLLPEAAVAGTARQVLRTVQSWRTPDPAPATTPPTAPTPQAPPVASSPASKPSPPPLDTPDNVTRVKKYGHAVLFGLLGALAALSLRSVGTDRSNLLNSILAPLVFAGATEASQLLTSTRSALWSDWLIDCLGAIAGWCLAQALTSSRRAKAAPVSEVKPNV